jgi:predicted DNA-binding transcriptional regulator YafY
MTAQAARRRQNSIPTERSSMDRFDRIYRLYTLFASGREARSAQSLQADLGCSRATLMRAIAELRDLFGAPLLWDATARGYRFDGEAPRRQLPGLWFSADELQALLVAQSLLAGLSEGLMPERIDALRGRVTALLAQGGVSPQQAAKALRVLPLAGRAVDPLVFRQVVSATLGAHRLAIHYRARSTGDVSERVVSPQRLVRYRDNWYLDAWCHTRDALRSFAVDAIESAQERTDEPAQAVSDAALDAHFGAAYGIFSGAAEHRAVLRFAAGRARWIAAERWHPAQYGRWLDDGRYELTVPFGDPRELILDVLRYGADVEVLEPPELRVTVAGQLRAAAAQYGQETPG